MDKRRAYIQRQKLKGQVSVNLYLKDEVLNAIDMEVERRRKEGKKTNRSQVTNEWIWEAMESPDIAHGMGVKT